MNTAVAKQLSKKGAGERGNKLTTYTPGKWKLSNPANDGVAYRILGANFPQAGEDSIVADLIRYPDQDPALFEANARLIAASPELYDELFRALAVIRNPQAFETEQVANDIERVLAKVTK